MSTRTADPQLEPLVVTIPEAARLLGLSLATIYNLIGSGELTRVKIGRAARIPMSDVRRLAGLDEVAS